MPGNSKAPLVVSKNPDEGQWEAWVGNNEKAFVSDTQTAATSNAVAKAHREHRPGVVVLKTNGKLKRFVPNDKYWKKWARGGPFSRYMG